MKDREKWARFVPPLAAISSPPTAVTPEQAKPLGETERRGRAVALAAEHGTAKTAERAVGAALNWLYRHQKPEGNWSIDYRQQCKGVACPGAGAVRSDTGATAMALLPFLAAGETPKSKGPYRKAVTKAIDWLIKQQKPDGDLSGGGEEPMFAHAWATIALCEAYGMTHDELLGTAGRRGVEYVERAQDGATGGWGPAPGDAADTSTFGWQVMALRSAQLAGLPVKAAAFWPARSDGSVRWPRARSGASMPISPVASPRPP